jgi:hypothetical protein
MTAVVARLNRHDIFLRQWLEPRIPLPSVSPAETVSQVRRSSLSCRVTQLSSYVVADEQPLQ